MHIQYVCTAVCNYVYGIVHHVYSTAADTARASHLPIFETVVANGHFVISSNKKKSTKKTKKIPNKYQIPNYITDTKHNDITARALLVVGIGS